MKKWIEEGKGIALGCLLISQLVQAETVTVRVQVTFVDPVTITATSPTEVVVEDSGEKPKEIIVEDDGTMVVTYQ